MKHTIEGPFGSDLINLINEYNLDLVNFRLGCNH
uniref:Uncharacterized protein n=1 Tax=Tetranychus urticae TaxID=32264 RepID=T1K769_TETUR